MNQWNPKRLQLFPTKVDQVSDGIFGGVQHAGEPFVDKPVELRQFIDAAACSRGKVIDKHKWDCRH